MRLRLKPLSKCLTLHNADFRSRYLGFDLRLLYQLNENVNEFIHIVMLKSNKFAVRHVKATVYDNETPKN